jgi:serine-type D-Ala-D-Ala carboxypeptidase (penicillin-binding protein 5/6)
MFLRLLFVVFFGCVVSDASAKVKKTTATKVKPKKTEEKKEEPANILEPHGIEVNSTHALLIDYATGRVLLAKNADEPLEPASMTKIMTAYMVMKALQEGRIKSESLVTISRNAREMEGSDMFLEVGDQVTVDDLIKGLIVVSGNDAAIALAEFLSGTQDSFAVDMTTTAKKMGCTQTQFKNASGLPQEGHLSTARDLIIMSIRTLEDFPKWYGVYKETSFTYRGITQPNRNVLLNQNIGCDGVKTGHAERPGYGMVASSVQNGRRLFLVVAGLRSMKHRAEEASRLLQWGFGTFGNYTIALPHKAIIELPVRYGTIAMVDIEAAPHMLTIHRNRLDQTKAVMRYEDVVEAPIKAGDQVGEVVVTHPDWNEAVTIPLIVSKQIEKASFLVRVAQSLQYLFKKG